MEQQTTPKSNGLENQLRNMILGNVTIADGQANQNVQAGHQRPGRGRGRGRGRGNSGGTHLNQIGTDQSTNPPTNAAPARGRGRGRGYHPNQHGHMSQTHHQVPRSPGMAHNAVTAHQNQYGGRGQPRSHYQQTNSPHSSQQQASYPPRPPMNYPKEDPAVQVNYMDTLAAKQVPKVEMSPAELDEKEAFRKYLQNILQLTFNQNYSEDIATISLVGFGSLASGYGMPGSDMDLAVVLGWKDPSKADQAGVDRDIPRLLERAILDAKMGGRLLTKTRVPILKICQHPTDVLYAALLNERKKWDELSEAEKNTVDLPEPAPPPNQPKEPGGEKPVEPMQHTNNVNSEENYPALGAKPATKAKQKARPKGDPKTNTPVQAAKTNEVVSNETGNTNEKGQNTRTERAWKREKSAGPLDFPKTGVGIQCDVNFDNPLGIHNTHMLRCYSLTDPRVRPMVLFVKSWAKTRKINSAYSGTLSSYGWVLMVLHYLVNIAQPPVCPNLQHSVPQPNDLVALEQFFRDTTISGYSVRFWRNEAEITQAAQAGRLTQNTQTVGALLRGFFQYYSSISPGYGYGPRPPQFFWTSEVLSLRAPNGILTKNIKGWVSATTKVTAEKKVTNRYLFAIEDPFEIDHNVARTVTHRGIVAIRDEFRRAWRIIRAVGQGLQPEGGIFDEVFESAQQAEDKEEPEKMNMEGLGVGDQGKSAGNAQHGDLAGAA